MLKVTIYMKNTFKSDLFSFKRNITNDYNAEIFNNFLVILRILRFNLIKLKLKYHLICEIILIKFKT